ncbi:hypothetical protein D9M71_496750 [compost metagenome]
MAIEDQPAGDGRQIGARLLDARRIDLGGEHLAEGLGGGVFGVGAVAQALVDVLQEPTVVVAEKEAQLAGGGGWHRLAFPKVLV